MNRRHVIRASILLTVGVLLMMLTTGFNPQWLLVDWSRPDGIRFPVAAQLEIATRWKPFKRSSLALLCGPLGAHLVMKSRLPLPSEYRSDSSPWDGRYSNRSALIFDWVQVRKRGIFIHSFENKSAVVNYGLVDTVLSAPLSDAQRRMVIDWFNRGAPRGVSFHLLETSTTLRASATKREVASFFKNCSGPTL